MIVGDPEAVSLYVTWQVPETSVQGDPVNDPVPEEVENETVFEGLYPPVRVTVQVVDDPVENDGHETAVVGVALMIVTVLVPGVPALLLLSPE